MYRTGQYDFDPLKRSLRSAKKQLRLRPKTARLLNYFLDHPGEVLRKDELIQYVWGHGHVDDQTLFQLIRDIRASLSDKRCVMTHPGVGYQWVWTVSNRDNRVFFNNNKLSVFGITMSMAASLAIMVWGTFYITELFQVSPQSTSSIVMSGSHSFSPVIRHMQAGLIARADGDENAALSEFKQALTIEPENVSLLLELSQSQLMLGQQSIAFQTAVDALSTARAQQNPINEVIASLYLSHIQYQSGDINSALNINQSAQLLAHQHELICAIELTERWDKQLQLVMHSETSIIQSSLNHPLQLMACQIQHKNKAVDI